MFRKRYSLDPKTRQDTKPPSRQHAEKPARKWKADRYGVNEKGQTDLHLGVLTYCVDDKLFKAAIRAGCDVNKADKNGQTALHVASKKGLSSCIRTLLEHGANTEILDRKDKTPLMYASQHGHPAAIEILVGSGASVNLSNSKGELALHYSCLGGHSECTELLLKYKSKPNYPDNDGTTPLILAARSNSVYVVQALLAAGAKPDKVDNTKRAAIHWTAMSGTKDVVDALIAAGASLDLLDKYCFTAFMYSICNNNFAVLESLVRAGCDKTSVDGLAGTALTLASLKGHEGSVRVLLAAGQNPDEFSFFGMTALMASVYESHHNLTQTILQYDPDVNLVSRLGFTAIFAALCHINDSNARTRHRLLVLLLQHGADPNQKVGPTTAFGNIMNGKHTPILFALTTGYVSLIKILLFAGSQVTSDELGHLFRTRRTNDVYDLACMLKPITEYKCSPQSLRHLCRLAIRNQLGKEAHRKLEELPIPKGVKLFLNFSDLTDIQPEREPVKCNVHDMILTMLDLKPCGLQAIEGSYLFKQIGESVVQAETQEPCKCNTCMKAQTLQATR